MLMDRHMDRCIDWHKFQRQPSHSATTLSDSKSVGRSLSLETKKLWIDHVGHIDLIGGLIQVQNTCFGEWKWVHKIKYSGKNTST